MPRKFIEEIDHRDKSQKDSLRLIRTLGVIFVHFRGVLVIEPEQIVQKIEKAFACTVVEIRDLTGTRDHYRLVVVSPRFQDQLPVSRHRLVYGALREEMKGAIHALTLETLTPDEWEEQRQ
jgi:stress-induced morphogen